MITLDQALAISFSAANSVGTEKINFIQSCGRVLAENIYSDSDMPPFNKSAMDGYACRKEDLDQELTTVETIAAGTEPTLPISAGLCSRIMTGAQVPKGADTVFMKEFSEEISTGKIRFTGTQTNSNICLQGSDLKKDDLVLKPGTLLKPQHIAVLASVGCTDPLVFKLPSIGIISTGSELVEVNQVPGLAQIRNSNGPQLLAQARRHGFPAKSFGIVADNKEQTTQVILQSVNESSVTILSGGVSVGDFDFVPQVISELGFEIHFSKISIKPGQHTTFASKGEKYIIGLPGNPVSSFIQFEVFVLPFLRKLMNDEEKEVVLPLRMGQDFARKKTDRAECLPVIINNKNEVEFIDYHGSAHIHAYNQAFGFITIPAGKTELKKGELVHVRPI
jgi:molybdopterin molybdotransferase